MPCTQDCVVVSGWNVSCTIHIHEISIWSYRINKHDTALFLLQKHWRPHRYKVIVALQSLFSSNPNKAAQNLRRQNNNFGDVIVKLQLQRILRRKVKKYYNKMATATITLILSIAVAENMSMQTDNVVQFTNLEDFDTETFAIISKMIDYKTNFK